MLSFSDESLEFEGGMERTSQLLCPGRTQIYQAKELATKGTADG